MVVVSECRQWVCIWCLDQLVLWRQSLLAAVLSVFCCMTLLGRTWGTVLDMRNPEDLALCLDGDGWWQNIPTGCVWPLVFKKSALCY